MPEVAVPWGDAQLQIRLPEHWTLQQVAQPELRSAGDDWPERLAMAMSHPCSGLALDKLLAARRNGRIVIVVEDVTRHSPLEQILAVVIKELQHAKIGHDQLEILFATGMHPAMTAEQARQKLGDLADHIRWRSNPWHDPSRYANLGKCGDIEVQIDRDLLQADLRIVISSVSPHLQAGFGGGYKMFFPGCASLETIRDLHRQGLSKFSGPLVGLGAEVNPMRCAIDAAGSLVDQRGKTFAIQYLLDERDMPSSIAAGEVLPAQRMLAKQCAVMSGIVTPVPGDVLITNAAPRDSDFWQSLKCIANTRWAARTNGVIICLTRCEGGLNGVHSPRWPIGPAWTRRLVRMLGANNIASLAPRLVPKLASDAAFFIRMAAQAIQRNDIFIVSPHLARSGVKFPALQFFADVESAMAAADAILGSRPQRVVVFPYGGATYPVLPATQTRTAQTTT